MIKGHPIRRTKPRIYSPISTIPVLAPFIPVIAEVVVKKSDLSTDALAHEIRNPLTNINLSVEMLKDVVTDESQRLYLEVILRASHKVNALIDELIKQQQPEKAQVIHYSMHQLLDEVLLMAADRLFLKNIIVTKIYAIRDYTCAVNQPGIKIALTNIIINAIDAMKQKNGQLRLTTKSINGRYTIQIEDNGCGIPAEKLKHIFTPFFTGKKDGLGIGLSATHDIFKANKIKVRVESEVGISTRFTLSFVKERPPFFLNKMNFDAAGGSLLLG